jgi:hypothetical protein
MKLAALLSLASLALVIAAIGCAHPQKRNDWRSPSPMQGAPGDGSSGGPGTSGDGGAPNQGPNPGPNVQPSSSDIQI